MDAAGIRMPLHRFAGTIRRNKHRDDRAHGRLQNPLAQNDVRAGEPSRRWEARWNKWKGQAPVKGFRKREIARGAKHWLAPGAAVVTDGLGCWSALEEAACSHQAIRTGSGRQAARMASFKWVNTTLGNIKSAITGTYRKLGPDHAGRYLASFAWRYNRRYQLQTMIPRFVHSAARTQPMPYRLLIAG